MYFSSTVDGTNGGTTITWTEVAGLPMPVGGSATPVYGVIGTNIYVAPMWNTNVYKFTGSTWVLAPPKVSAIVGNGGWVSCGEYFYAVGGWDGGYSRRAYRCDGATWTELGNFSAARTFCQGATIGTNIYIIGGEYSGYPYKTNVDHLLPNNSFEQVPGIPNGVDETPGCAELNGYMYVIGGSSSDQPYGSTNVWKGDGVTWSRAAALPAARKCGAAATLNNKIYFFGGKGTDGAAKTNVFQFDGVQWQEVPGFSMGTYYFGAITMGGSIYCIGGGTPVSSSITNVWRMDVLSTTSSNVTTLIISSNSITLGGETRSTWPTGNGAASNNLSDITDPAAARANLGLGSAATNAAGAFLTPTGNGSQLTGITAGQVAGALAASNNLSDVAYQATARANLGLGTAATNAASAFLSTAGGVINGSLAINGAIVVGAPVGDIPMGVYTNR
jgi:hypothetical protein